MHRAAARTARKRVIHQNDGIGAPIAIQIHTLHLQPRGLPVHRARVFQVAPQRGFHLTAHRRVQLAAGLRLSRQDGQVEAGQCQKNDAACQTGFAAIDAAKPV